MRKNKIKTIIFLCLITVLCASLFFACAKKDDVEPDLPATETFAPTPTPTATPTPTPIPEYRIAITRSVEEDLIYVYDEMDTESRIIGAAVNGVDFHIVAEFDEWTLVLYTEDETGYIHNDNLTFEIRLTPATFYEAYFYMPAVEEMGHVHVRFNNKVVVEPSTYTVIERVPESDDPDARMIDVEVVKTRIDVFTTGGTLLAEDTTLVLQDAVIRADPIPTPPCDNEVTAPTETVSPPEEDEENEQDLDTIPTPSPSPTPTPIPVEIVISRGQITSCTGVELDEDIEFDIDEDKGHVVTTSGEVIALDGLFFEEADISVTNGHVIVPDGELYFENGYYFVPTMLKDELVDIRRFAPDIHLNILFAQDNNIAHGNVYEQEICLIQRGTLEKLLEAQAIFEEDGYSIIAYDIYRPYSVTCILYDIHRDGTYVAGKRFGSVHNKGAAIDMSLIDNSTGEIVEMPSPMHTLNSSSNRNNPHMTDTARENMNYMADVMRQCGFSTISSEWWHFNDTESDQYMRTDHDLPAQIRIINLDDQPGHINQAE